MCDRPIPAKGAGMTSSIRSGMETVWKLPEGAKPVQLIPDGDKLYAELESGERVEILPVYQKLNFGELG